MQTKIDELRSGGFTDTEIAAMLNLPVTEVRKKKELVGVEGDGNDLEVLKTDIYATAKKAVSQIKNDLGGRPDAQELSKLTDSLSKLYTAFFKNEANTTVNIMQNNLSMFKDSLKG